MTVPTALTIAGSDSSGGAGIQADLKTMSAFGVFGATALTAVTAQNTLGVAESLFLSAQLVAGQIDAVVQDMGIDAAKTGMLGTAEVIEIVAERVGRHGIRNLVVDPVMIATSGASLIEDDAVVALRTALMPRAYLVTPNAPEAEVLSGVRVVSLETMEEAARAVHSLGAANVLVKAGHVEGSATDVLFDGESITRFSADRIEGGKIHGTGCTLSAAIASGLALGLELTDAIVKAKSFVTRGIAAALDMGTGSALVNHFVKSSVK
ncbi:MAG: bifunctional hydroxymethylpyrimidine kinase/phosphomethylpyrimidine kinase [Candidatus Eisenbacteria bacterium]|nr:bifunctional hydroxymethylpyrimidine kinase/phosphomethylpyrimidine kinase [Candidatus Eisenbacteria bacterium]